MVKLSVKDYTDLVLSNERREREVEDLNKNLDPSMVKKLFNVIGDYVSISDKIDKGNLYLWIKEEAEFEDIFIYTEEPED